MNENEKKLFYHVLNEQITEEPTPELASKIMHTVHNYAQNALKRRKILEIIGYSLLAVFPVIFVGCYLFFFSDFKLPVLHFSFEMPSKIYIIPMFIIFVFLLVELHFRKKLYEN